jgi:hypothetical protein
VLLGEVDAEGTVGPEELPVYDVEGDGVDDEDWEAYWGTDQWKRSTRAERIVGIRIIVRSNSLELRVVVRLVELDVAVAVGAVGGLVTNEVAAVVVACTVRSGNPFDTQ